MTNSVYMFAGLPGSGKTEACQMGVSLAGGDTISLGSIVRQMAYEDGYTDPSSHELAEYAAEQREEQGRAFAAEHVHGLYLRDELDLYFPLFIDGIRHRKEVAEFREAFADGILVWIDAPFETRLARLQDRGRDDEDQFTAADLSERDDRELSELGVETLRDDEVRDYIIENDGTLGDLKSSLDRIIHG